MPMLKAAEGKYQRVIVLPERDANEERFSNVGACTVAVYGDLHAPAEGSITIFPIPCRDRVIKTALCLSEDFEGGWIRRCIEGGLRVYMKKENPMKRAGGISEEDSFLLSRCEILWDMFCGR